jgi:predicted acyl esterase
MKLRTLAFASLLLFLAALATRLFADQNYPVKVERGVSAKMRDGVILRGDIFRPDAEGKFPVLLQRTPYRRAITWGYDLDFAQRAASRGYVIFLQDVRGRYTSDGEWYPFLHESEDGYDTVEWIGRFRTAESACSAGLMSERHKCSQPSRIRRIWLVSVRS